MGGGAIRAATVATTASSLADGRSIVITGEAGVGKSWLAQSVADQLSETWHVERLVGTPAIAEVTFSAVAHLLPEASAPAPEMLVAAVLGAMQARGESRQTVLYVDDLDLLDVGSTAVVHQFHAQGGIVLASVRSSQIDQPGVQALIKSPSTIVTNLTLLDAHQTAQLVAAKTAARVSIRLSNELWRLSSGNPFVCLSLLREAQANESLIERDGVLLLEASATFGDVVGNWKLPATELSDAGQRAFDLVAIGEPLAERIIEKLGIVGELESLEDCGAVVAENFADERAVRTAHPLIGERLRNDLGGIRRRRLVRELAEAHASDAGGQSSPGLVRTALWAAEADFGLDASVADAAVQAAIFTFDLQSALALIDRIEPDSRSVNVSIAEGRAGALVGDLARWEEGFDRAKRLATTESELASVVVAKAELQLFMLGDEAAALAELSEAYAGATEAHSRTQIGGMLNFAAGMTGDFGPALNTADGLLELPGISPAAELRLIIGNSLAQALVGTLGGLDARLDRGTVLAEQLRHAYPLAEEQITMTRAMASWADADGRKAERLLTQASRNAMESGQPSSSYLSSGGIYQMMVGDIDEALVSFEQAWSMLRDLDPFGMQAQTFGGWSMASAMVDRLDEARGFLRRGRAEVTWEQPRSRLWLDRAEAWIAASETEARSNAAHLAVAAGQRATDNDHIIWGAMAAHDASRFGHPELAESLLDDLVGRSHNSGLVTLLAEQCRANAAQDSERLAQVAGALRKAGAQPPAAGSMAQASLAAANAGDLKLANRYAFLAHRWSNGQPIGATPELQGCPNPLSDREFEVAALVASGHTSKTISEKLFLSSRTIENHLARIYVRLGLKNRDELSVLMTS